MQQWCRNNFCPARIAEEKVFLLKLFNLAFHFFSSHWINEEISLLKFSALSINFFSSANFYCDTFRLTGQMMQQRCRTNFCPARIVEEKVFLLKLFNLGWKSSAQIEFNEEIFSKYSSRTPHKYSLQGATNCYMKRFRYEHNHLTLFSCQDHSKHCLYWFISCLM